MNSTPTMPDDEVISDEEPAPVAAPRPRRLDFGWAVGHPDAIVTGLSAHIAERLAIDPLWVRLAFVGSALFGGIGVYVYIGLWLALIVARSTPVRLLGAAVVIGSFLAFTSSNIGFSTGPFAVIGLLAGLAVALWKPVPTWADGHTASDVRSSEPWAVPDPMSAASAPNASYRGDEAASDWSAPTVVRPHRYRRPPRPPSILGRTTLAVALIVAAVGALIDELNEGRLHPEQWLGAAAIVCGIGLLVGTVRGHARWLIVPAIGLAVAGYGSGVLARIGVQPSDALSSSYTWVGEQSTGPYRVHTGFGSADVQATEVPTAPVTVDVRTANGMSLQWRPEVAVEIRSRLGNVTMQRDGVSTSGSTFRLGPDGPPDVIIDLRMARGEIRVTDVSSFEQELGQENFDSPVVTVAAESFRPDGTPIGPIAEVAPGIAVTHDGWLILNNGFTILDDLNNVIFGDWFSADGQVVTIPTPTGEYRIVGPVLFTPEGPYYDLDALRQMALAESSAEIPAAVVPADDLDVTPIITVATVTLPAAPTNGVDE